MLTNETDDSLQEIPQTEDMNGLVMTGPKPEELFASHYSDDDIWAEKMMYSDLRQF